MRRLALGLVVALGCWLGLLVWAPVAIASPSRAAIVPAIVTYSAGSVVCHQQATRSFRIDGRQMPVCARCTGLYASALAGALLALGSGRRRVGHATRRVLALAAAPTAASWVLEFAGAIRTSNLQRALLAVPLGVAAGWVAIALLREDRSPSARHEQGF